MEKKDYKTYGARKVQVFELTMDNPEDQDELNRRLRKPDESADAPYEGNTPNTNVSEQRGNR
jgi:hypothetical protein